MICRFFALIIGLCLTASLSSAQIGGLPGGGPTLPLYGAGLFGTPQTIGANSRSTSGTTLTITTSNAIASGDLVAVCVLVTGTSSAPTVSGVSDGTNTYTAGGSPFAVSSNTSLQIWYKTNASAVSSSASLTATFGTANSAVMAAFHVASTPTGVGSFDKSNGSSTSSSDSASVSVTPAQSHELYAGCSSTTTGTSTVNAYSGASGFTNLSVTKYASNADALAMDYENSINSATSFAPAWTMTVGTAGLTSAYIAAFAP